MATEKRLKVTRVPLPDIEAPRLPDPDLMYQAVLEHNRQIQNGVEFPDDFAIVQAIQRRDGVR